MFWANFCAQKKTYMIGCHRKKDADDNFINKDNQDFVLIPDDKKYWYADPILFEHNGKAYIFCEAYNKKTQKGELGYFVINDDGSHSKIQIIMANKEYHYSFPNVFQHNDSICMIPETQDQGVIYIYKAVEFPNKWEIEKILLDDGHYADSTLLKNNDNLYLITSEVYAPEDVLTTTMKIFEVAEDRCIFEETGRENTSLAGPVIKYKDMLIKPTQKCVNSYGEATILSELKSVEPYKEEYIKTILPDAINVGNAYSIGGTHTWGMSEHYEVVDVWYFKNVFDMKTSVKFIKHVIKSRIRKLFGNK